MMTMTKLTGMAEPESGPARSLPVPRLLLLCVLGFGLNACGITAPRSAPGFAHLESLGAGDVDREFSLSIGPALLRFAASHIDDDPEIAALLRGLEGVRIRVYEINGDRAAVAERMQRMSTHLREDGWSPVMLVRSRDEQTHMLVKFSQDRMQGLTVLSSDGESEAVVVNLVGEIQPKRFSDIMLALDVDAPGVNDIQVEDSL